MIRFFLALTMLLAASLASAPASASMVALVIGNHDYVQVNSLKNPRSDARAISEMFDRIGFDVETAFNLDRADLTRKLREFKKRAETADTAVFFYAGHGMEIDGVNYLIPTDAVLARQDDAEFEAVRLEMASSAAAQAKRLSVVLIDACRDNIFQGDTRSSGKGFVNESPRQRQVITFSTAPGAKAYDGDGDMSPFAQALVEILPTALNYDVRQLFGGLGARVSELAQAEQEPHTQSVGFSPETVTLKPGLVASAVAAGISAPVVEAPLEKPRIAAAPDPWATNRPLKRPQVTLEATSGAEQPAPRAGSLSDGVPVAAAPSAPERIVRPAGFQDRKTPKPVSVAAAPTAQPAPAPSLAPIIVPAPPRDENRQFSDFSTFRDCATCPEMVVLPAGQFEMGGSSFSFHATDAEYPRHDVQVGRFALARFETTFEEWDACVRDGYCQKGRVFDYGWGRGKQPVLRVSYNDVIAPRGFVEWLNAKAGGNGGYRLPTEAEWEYAAAAGSDDDYATGGSITRSAARFGGLDTDTDAPSQPSAVGRFPANAWGLHDMHGNVAEMVADCWNDNYDGAPTDGMIWGSGNCRSMPVRGGSWADEEHGLRLSAREMQRRSGRANRIGFRIAKDVD